jgi:hypothetical protein
MPFVGSHVTVNATDTVILVGGDPIGNQPAVGRGQCLIRNMDTAKTVFLGGVGVTPTNGFDLLPGEVAIADDMGVSDTLHGIVASGSAIVAVFYQE